MRIGILTFHRAYNCGAMLQAWALRKTLERMGHRVEFPACNHVGETKRFWLLAWPGAEKKGWAKVRSVLGRSWVNLCNLPANLGSIPCEGILQKRYRAFRGRFLPERDCRPEAFDQHYDVMVSGSDQVFNESHTREDAPVFFCENKPKSLRAIAYAASYGDTPPEGCRLERVVRALDHFDAVSMRETMARDLLTAESRKEIAETLDPTLLVTADDYAEIAAGEIPDKPYLFMYTLYTDPFYLDTAKELARRLGVKCIIAPCYQFSRWKAPRGLTYSVSPDRLVQYARNAKYVLAASFHGTVLGIVFKKPFLSLRGAVDPYESRPAVLLRKVGCLNRLVNPTTPIDEMERLLREPLPDCTAALETERAASLAWLKKAIG